MILLLYKGAPKIDIAEYIYYFEHRLEKELLKEKQSVEHDNCHD